MSSDNPFAMPDRYSHVIIDGDPVDMSEFELGPREIVCTRCWCVHRPEVDCDG